MFSRSGEDEFIRQKSSSAIGMSLAETFWIRDWRIPKAMKAK
jgi:hypothetical protein